jgi:YHS domain-containing protein
MGALFIVLSRVLILLAAFWLLRSLARVLFGRQRASVRASTPVPIAGELKRDPSCGAYVATESALKIRFSNEELYFCSPQCHEEYVRAHRERPA